MEEFSPIRAQDQEETTKPAEKSPKKRRRLSFMDTYYPAKAKTEASQGEEPIDDREGPLGYLLKKLKGVLFKNSLVVEPLELSPVEASLPASKASTEALADSLSFGLLYDRSREETVAQLPNISPQFLDSSRDILPSVVPSLVGAEATSVLPLVPEEVLADEEEATDEKVAATPTIGVAERISALGTASPISEILRDRKVMKLRRDVRHIKSRVNDAETQQQVLKKQQEKFSDSLAEQQAHEDRLRNVTIPRLEKARQELRQRLETVPSNTAQPEISKKVATAVSPEVGLANKAVASNKGPEKAPQPTATEVMTRPEVIQKTVEQAAEKNIPIESVYEHRHEIKDQERQVTTTVVTPLSGPKHSVDISPPAQPVSQFQAIRDNVTKLLSEEQNQEAMRGGFWAAVVILVLLGVLMFVVR